MELLTSNTEAIGFWAAVLTTIAFAPQVVRTWRMGGNELSWLMLGMFGSGVGLWFVYGYLRQSAPLMLANGLTFIQVLTMVAVKLRTAAHSAARAKRRPANLGATPAQSPKLPDHAH
jgi:MtN3 and saliva related transmembrane protein